MFNTVEEYLTALKAEMQSADPALLQDALSDAREHLTAALAEALATHPATPEAQALAAIVDNYGTPAETASAYREVERRTPSPLIQTSKPASLFGRFFGVYLDPRTWGSLFFMFISLVTGIIYFTWAVTGASLSISLLILIIGIPFALLFLLSVQGVALFEGRMVEALLGERMPRRPAFAQPGLKFIDRLRALVSDWHTWRALLYMLLQLPLGIIYFSINIVLLAFEIGIMLAPLAELIFRTNYIQLDLQGSRLPAWILMLMPVAGFLLLTLNLHLVRTLGWLHGRYAKWLLVS